MIYKSYEDARYDARLFSRMNMNEDKPLYVMMGADGWYVDRKFDHTKSLDSVAINGTVFNKE